MALANIALYKKDTTRALRLYSRVKTPHAAWNQSQVNQFVLCMIHKCTCCFSSICAEYRSLTKEHPLAEHHTSLPKRVVGALLSALHLTTKVCPCHVYSDLMPSKRIIWANNNLQRNHQRL